MTADGLARTAIPEVLGQHAEDTATLRGTRSVLVRAPHVRLRLLRRLDDRLAAHLDGLAVAGDAGRRECAQALAGLTRGTLFAAAVLAIEAQDTAGIDTLLSLAEGVPEVRSGLSSAFGWVSPQSLKGLTRPLLESPSPFRRDLGLDVCALHGVHPGPALEQALAPPASPHALEAAGRLGAVALLPACLAALSSDVPASAFAAARAALRLGDRGESLTALQSLASQPGEWQAPALTLVLKVLAPDAARALLKPLAQAPAQVRTLIRGIGAAGDPYYVPWLLKQMADPKLTRLAGEALSTITGLDLAYLDLDRKPPEDAVFGPDDDPAHADVALDEDESLPWPDADKLAAWWQADGARFEPGRRYFCGEPPTAAHCTAVLKDGFQRHRIAAAEYLSLMQPDAPLFNVAAPAWRQERLLQKAGG